MTSMDVLQLDGLLDYLDDYSIISDNPIVNGDVFYNITNTEDCDVENLQYDLMPATPDLSNEALQSLISDVVSLKHLLQKNKQQLQKFLSHESITSMLQKEVLLKEADESIANLKKENLELRNIIAVREMKSKNARGSTFSTEDESTLSDDEVDFEVVNKKEVKSKRYKCGDKALDKDKNKDKLQECTIATIQHLQDTVEAIKQSLAIKEVELQEEISSHEETKKILSTVQINYDRVTRLLQIQSKDQKEKESLVEQCEQDANIYLEKIDFINAQLLSAQIQLQEKESAINSLTSELQLLKEESKSIPVLKSQESAIELWEQDDKMYLEKIDSITALLLSAQGLLQDKESEINSSSSELQAQLQDTENEVNSLTSELQAQRVESESIPDLNSQVEVYKEQLSNVFLAKDATVEAVNRLTQGLHDNESLSIHDSCQENNSKMEGSCRGKRNSQSTLKKLEVRQINGNLECPNCFALCTSASAYEKHRNHCLDKGET